MADPASYRPAPGTIPTEPGVYRFIDAHGTTIYVGKAKNLRNRLNSYFADPDGLHFRTRMMVHTAASVQWTVVATEAESLQLEYTWIKQFDPRFNVRYRDDKSYPWLCITWSDEYPRVFVGRGAKKKGWRYFGPFGQAWAVRDTVDLLLKVFPIRSCSNATFNNAARSRRPCLYGDIGKCSAPCVDRISAADHRELVKDFCDFWAGNTKNLEKKLTAQMSRAAEEQEYEQAAKYRDALFALRQATEKNAIVLGDGTDADVFAVASDELQLAIQVFFVRKGRVLGQRSWVADRASDDTDSELLENFLLALYSDEQGFHSPDGQMVPPIIMTPEPLPSGSVLADILSDHRGSRVRLHSPKRGDKKALMDTVTRNADEALVQHKMKRASDLATRSQALEELQSALGMSAPPLRIEGFDISHTQGTQVVGSMVVFEDGLPRKSEYRRFVIKSFEGSNDTLAMDEVLRRRLRRMLDDRAEIADPDASGPAMVDPQTGKAKKFAYAPSLIVVDGGLPQVNAAYTVLDELGFANEIMLIGLAKRLEEVWLPYEDYPIILPRSSEALYLLQRVRDESHRFAITHHRSRRSKSMIESILDDVPGLGEVRRKTLTRRFPSVKKLREATVAEIAELPGIGPKTAQAIADAVANDQQAPAINTATGEVIDS